MSRELIERLSEEESIALTTPVVMAVLGGEGAEDRSFNANVTARFCEQFPLLPAPTHERIAAILVRYSRAQVAGVRPPIEPRGAPEGDPAS